MIGPTLKGCRCQCAGCGEYFASERAFERHRIGSYADPDQWQGTRRCLNLSEMLANGWTRSTRGFLLQPDSRRAGAGEQGALQTQAATGVHGGEGQESPG